jgi:hypothetical protein
MLQNDHNKEKKIFNTIIIILSLLFFLFVETYELITYQNEYNKSFQYARTLSFLVWNLDRVTASDYLKIILQNNDYKTIQVVLEDKSVFLKFESDSLTNIENLFLKLNFIKIYEIKVPILYNDKIIGFIEVHWINRNLYIYNYILLVFILISVILYFYFRILIQRKILTITNTQLEYEIKQKNEAFTEIQKLKLQQDGDYYLTSLLLIPLASNYGKNEKVDVEFFVKQRKGFSFKNLEREIGGDICISHIIELRNRKFTVCLNADAMGKSIQGAGGCLVLGSVFEAIIERTKLSSSMNQMLPERWLKYAFLELHKVFESFDGSMMASIFICIIDNDNGFMYYMNAEHPYPVLFRYNKAEFLDTDFMFYKLGIDLSQRGFLYVRTFQLKNDDIIIIGSDGKDDILLEIKENGEQIINTDDNIFLEIVEQTNADLIKIYNMILSKGKLIDDFSLLKIHYKFNSINYKFLYIKTLIYDKKLIYVLQKEMIEQIESDQPLEIKLNNIYLIFRKNILYLIRKQYFEQCILLLEELLNIYPEKEELLFYIAYSLFKIKKYLKAIDYAEALRLRNIKHRKNLMLLTKIYLKQNEYIRANEIIEMYLDFYKNEPYAEKISQKIKYLIDIKQKNRNFS